ncbi:7TM protein involved in diverse intracellular signaling [Aquimarina sp. MAR_2010_214]|uniref:7TM-DISM domain-containing protein n=1 Tax=Aquimarina sp. MAR_2010_214 TaxID=1250026 RepID=UPI000C6FDEA6|nr:7TM-DISM domain-containing protein [Aquimarina sp. MAR_2010_214]PKV51442.1 7TM protein involved in diverse intracellular signaling [Aquimarina sp. MAR_2010_214]
MIAKQVFKNIPKPFGLFFFLIFCCIVSGYAQKYQLTNDVLEKEYLDNSVLFIYEDVTTNLSFEQISAENFQHHFVPKQNGYAYDSSGTIWLKFTIENTSDARRDFVVFSNDWDVQFFTKNKGNNFFTAPQGVLPNSFNNKLYTGENADGKILDYLLPNTSRTYYIKMPGALYNVSFKSFDFVYISDRAVVKEKALFDLWTSSIYVGVLFLVLLANFYLMITAFKKSYIFYAFYSISHVLFFTGYYQIPTLLSFTWPITHSIFLPITSSLYLLFVHEYLSIEKHSRVVSIIFKSYIICTILSVIVLFYLCLTDMVTYYHVLPKVNITNLTFLLVSSFLIMVIPGKFKYFILLGTLFIAIGATFTWITQYNDAMVQTFSYSIAGNAIEKIVFLFGIFYLHNQEQNAARVKLLSAQKQLELSKQQLKNFSNSIREKNKLIETFEQQIEASTNTLPQKEENLQQLTKSIILTEEDWVGFKKLYEEVHPNFFYILKSKYPTLTNAEIRMIALLKLHLSNKEIAGMLGINSNSVVKTKYRLRKKISDEEDIDIDTVIESI